MKKGRIKREKDDYITFARFCLNNEKFKPAQFIRMANKIDLFRNKFPDAVLYNYFLYFKRYIKDGYICKGAPKDFVKAIKNVNKEKNYKEKEDNICCVKQKTLSYEEIIKHIDNEYNNLQEKYNEQLKDIAKNIEILEQKRKDLDNFLMFKTQDLNDKRNRLIREYFERI